MFLIKDPEYKAKYLSIQLAIAVSVLLFLNSSSVAADIDIYSMDLEQLLNIKVVSVSKKSQSIINLLRAPCTYPRGKTAGYYGAENRKRRATLTSKTQTIILPVARPRGIAS